MVSTESSFADKGPIEPTQSSAELLWHAIQLNSAEFCEHEFCEHELPKIPTGSLRFGCKNIDFNCLLSTEEAVTVHREYNVGCCLETVPD